MSAALTVADLNTEVDHEPRVADLRLGFSLGMKNPASAIRKLIKRHENELARFGQVFSIWKKPGPSGGRPGREFWLNRKQALYITAKSDTAAAADVTIQMVEVFDAWHSGRIAATAHPALDPGLVIMLVAGREVLVDAGAYQIGEGQEAVVCAHNGKIEVLTGPLRPSSMTRELGKRSVVGPARIVRSDGLRQEERSTMYIVLGRVVRPGDASQKAKPVKVRAHRRSRPIREIGAPNLLLPAPAAMDRDGTLH